jgi:two-component system OmpR family sensor kinase/two-component system sensor histidine kinase BaeS
MTSHSDLAHSVNQIRRRLFLILMEAFGAVVLLTVLLLIGLLAVVVNGDALGVGISIVMGRPLESYYAGHGSWDGVETIIVQNDLASPPNGERQWERTYLLDAQGRVVVDRGRVDTLAVGQPYTHIAEEDQVPLLLNGQTIGFLVVQHGPVIGFPRYLAGLILPLIFISFFTGALTLLIGFLLVRRMVTPLADVIAAAQSVAAGDLSTRVQVRGPGDLKSLSDSFNRMADSLEANDEQRRNLMADVAHELRTPLTVIRGRLEGIVDGIYPPDEDHVAPVLEETYVLERLVEDLRLLTLAESRQLHFDPEPIQLGDLAERAVDLFQAQAEDKHIDLQLKVEANTPTVQADPQRVGQVIGNLVSNALRYVPENGHVQILVSAEGKRVRVAVRDDGPGVPEADLPKLFDRFWRGEKSRARAAGGAGLGLAIARQLIEAQGGSISAHNLPGGGLEVAFVL